MNVLRICQCMCLHVMRIYMWNGSHGIDSNEILHCVYHGIQYTLTHIHISFFESRVFSSIWDGWFSILFYPLYDFIRLSLSLLGSLYLKLYFLLYFVVVLSYNAFTLDWPVSLYLLLLLLLHHFEWKFFETKINRHLYIACMNHKLKETKSHKMFVWRLCHIAQQQIWWRRTYTRLTSYTVRSVPVLHLIYWKYFIWLKMVK